MAVLCFVWPFFVNLKCVLRMNICSKTTPSPLHKPLLCGFLLIYAHVIGDEIKVRISIAERNKYLAKNYLMRFQLLFYFLILNFSIGICQISPTLVSTANIALINTTLSVEIAIGEPITDMYSGSNQVITNGFLQPDPIVIVNSVKTISDIVIKIFPNPFNKYLFIESGFNYLSGILIDYTGRKIFEADSNNTWDVSQISTGVYTLLLSDKNRKLVYTTKLCRIEF